MNKKSLSESDICDKYIRPAIERAGWNGIDQIYREYPLRAGRMVVRGRRVGRDATTVLRGDCALFYKLNIPLAVVEAKDNRQAIGAGMAQAITYGQLRERNLAPAEFPSPAELWARCCAWTGWSADVRKVAAADYAPAKTPRDDQPKAVNVVVPVPPLAEQSRIVARVTQLRRLCADLRQRLTASQTTRCHLAEALVDDLA